MNVTKVLDGDQLTLNVEGRLDTNTAPILEQTLTENMGAAQSVVLDFTPLTYISSAGLRVLVAATSMMEEKGGSLVIRHATPEVMEIFEITGLVDILQVEE